MKLIPLTSLPRTGSTLLLYILNQNPSFEIGPDSEIGNILYHNKTFIEYNINHFQLPHEKVTECFIDFCRKGTEAWIDKISSPNNFFIDKSRHWLKDLDYIFKLFPNIKILITIRDLRGIINSFEKINNNSLYVDRVSIHRNISNDLQKERVASIFDLFFLKDGLFSLKELIDIPKKYKNQIKICRYEDLISNPQKIVSEIYNFLEIRHFNHNFKNIEQKIYYDNQYQPYGCHKIKSSIEFKKQDFSELRDDIQKLIITEYLWYYQEFYPEILMDNLI
jgi:sulfotransferase